MTDEQLPDGAVPMAVMFADLGDSARLYERLGDTRAREVTSSCLAELERIVERFEGRVVKRIGDELMCVFPGAATANDAACEMQLKVASDVESGLTIHIGYHFGPVLPEEGDVFGDAVNLAARVVGLAHSRQILTTSSTVELLDPRQQRSTRWVDQRHVKGKREDVDLFEVIWEASDLTEIRIPKPPKPSALKITMGDLEVIANEDRPSVTFGRGPDNDIVIADSVVSRRHAKIEQRGGKWLLSDHSINGTVIQPEQGALITVHNEQVVLPRAGQIGIGSSTPEAQNLPLKFELLA